MSLFSSRPFNALPGFKRSLAYTLFWLLLIVLLPLAALAWQAHGLTWDSIWQTINEKRVWSALKLSFGAAFIAAAINAVMGFLLAWVLVRYSIPGKKIIDALIDLPFALPTAVAGITLATLYAPNGLLGAPLAQWGIQVAFTPLGIVVALIFVSLPFVVRTVEPVLKDLEPELEEAATCLGASAWQTFLKVIFPAVFPAIVTGFTMAFARATGEFGSVIFIAGNLPMTSEIAPLLIIARLDRYDTDGATVLALAMLSISFLALLMINLLQRLGHRRYGLR